MHHNPAREADRRELAGQQVCAVAFLNVPQLQENFRPGFRVSRGLAQ